LTTRSFHAIMFGARRRCRSLWLTCWFQAILLGSRWDSQIVDDYIVPSHHVWGPEALRIVGDSVVPCHHVWVQAGAADR
jgi:hypothetical protein